MKGGDYKWSFKWSLKWREKSGERKVEREKWREKSGERLKLVVPSFHKGGVRGGSCNSMLKGLGMAG